MANRAKRNLVVTRTVSVSAVALTTLGVTALAQATPAHASGQSKPRPKPVTQGQIDSYLASHPDYPTALKNGIGESAQPNFGIGKPGITVMGKPGTYPSNFLPNFNGLLINMFLPDFNDTVQCTTIGSPGAVAECPMQPIPTQSAFSVTIDSSTPVPSGFLNPPAVTGSIPDCDS